MTIQESLRQVQQTRVDVAERMRDVAERQRQIQSQEESLTTQRALRSATGISSVVARQRGLTGYREQQQEAGLEIQELKKADIELASTERELNLLNKVYHQIERELEGKKGTILDTAEERALFNKIVRENREIYRALYKRGEGYAPKEKVTITTTAPEKVGIAPERVYGTVSPLETPKGLLGKARAFLEKERAGIYTREKRGGKEEILKGITVGLGSSVVGTLEYGKRLVTEIRGKFFPKKLREN